MYSGFNLLISEEDKDSLRKYAKIGEVLFQNQKQKIKDTLDEYINIDGSINVAMIEKDWFRSISANVFISHSHTDEGLVKFFAGYLYESFGLTCFIDSCVWGYANDLLKMIDNEYCKIIVDKDGSRSSYDYNKRN